MHLKRLSCILSLLFVGVLAHCGGSEMKRPPVVGLNSELNHCLQLSKKKKHEEAVDCLEVFKSRYPGSREASDADLAIADSHFRGKEYLLAAETYKEYIEQFPYSPKVDYAYYQGGMSYLKDAPKTIDRDQKNLELATQYLSIAAQQFPNSAYREQALEGYKRARFLLADQSYYVGRFYYKSHEYLAAIPRFREVLEKYPGTELDEKTFYYLVSAGVKLGEKERMQDVVKAFGERYPNSSYYKKVQAMTK